MTLKEFLETQTLIGFELYQNGLFNVHVESGVYGLDIDTSGIPFGSKLLFSSNFRIEGDILSVEDIEFNMNEIKMLLSKKPQDLIENPNL